MHVADEILGITAAKTELPQRVKRLQSGELERVVIVRQNSPIAVILTVDEYDRMRTIENQRETFEDLKLLLESLSKDNGGRISLEDIKAELGID
ncbi:MAG TPA: type II toxin-antitoxin system prevent-host-death family antitoxin [Actinomycetota bacterium]|nr:type II toxin-antitoxin system prevent-host-death family antitoxin [Actinomycetota bacterium]